MTTSQSWPFHVFVPLMDHNRYSFWPHIEQLTREADDSMCFKSTGSQAPKKDPKTCPDPPAYRVQTTELQLKTWSDRLKGLSSCQTATLMEKGCFLGTCVRWKHCKGTNDRFDLTQKAWRFNSTQQLQLRPALASSFTPSRILSHINPHTVAVYACWFCSDMWHLPTMIQSISSCKKLWLSSCSSEVISNATAIWVTYKSGFKDNLWARQHKVAQKFRH